MSTKDADIEAELTDERMEAATKEDEGSGIVGGLDENVAGALAYLFGFITGLIFYLIEDENEFVRFHAVQSMLVFGGIIAITIGISILQIFLEMIPFVGWIMSVGLALLSMLLAPIGFVLWVVLLIKAYKGQRYSLPVTGDVAERYV